MFDGHVCSLLLISLLMLVHPGFPGVYNPTYGTAPGLSQCTSPIAKSLLKVVFLLYYLYIVMFDGHVCSLLLISPLILVRPGL